MLLHLGSAAFLPPLLPAASGAVELLGLLMLKLTAIVARAVPPQPARSLPCPPLLVASLALLLLAAAVGEHARVERRSEDRRRARWCALIALLLAWVAPFVPAVRPPDRAAWLLVLDVGQGDGTIVHTPDATVLVDAGPSSESRDEGRLTLIVEIDGGINADTIEQAAEAGVDCFVAGSAVYGAADPAGAVAKLRQQAGKAN